VVLGASSSFFGSFFLGSVAAAQEGRPQITPGERKAPRKKDAEPRAVALLKLSADGKASLVPIAILIDGKFWDASAYKASPVPMALEPGTVYEAERTGSSLGLFTIGAALHSNAANASVPWLATGAYVPAGSDTRKKALHAETTPVGIDNSDAPPRLTKNPGASTAPASAPSSAPSSSTPSSSPSPSAPSSAGSSAPSSGSSTGSGSGDEPPRLSRPASSQSPPADSAPGSSSTPTSGSTPQNGSSPSSSGQTSSTQTSPTQSGSGQPSTSTTPQPGDKPADSKSDGKSDTAKSDTKSTDRENVPASDSGAGEANRPRLRRGKPATSFADEEIPGYSKLGVPAVMSSVAAKPTPATTAGPVQLIPAISDSSGPEPRSYGFEWVQGDEADRRKQLIALVQEQVRAYVDAQAKATVAPKTAPNAASRRAPAKKTPEPVLSNVQMTTYDLWSTNQPIVIFSADAQMPAKSAPQTAKSTTSSGTLSAPAQQPSLASSGAPSGPSSAGSSRDSLQYSVLIVACPDIYNNIHKLYAGVTDKYHLDITPRLELIDAVDADGDGRGELLFRETSDAGTGWVIYRANADKLWKIFDSLNPE
jgi:hypothetical protein